MHEALLGGRRLLGVGASGLGPSHRLVDEGLGRLQRVPAQPLDELGLEELVQKVRQLHDVAVGVEDLPGARVTHLATPSLEGDTLSPLMVT